MSKAVCSIQGYRVKEDKIPTPKEHIVKAKLE